MPLPSDAPGPAGRLPRRPVAIIDIGSNSVRLVIYEGWSRAPTPLYNEKLLCGLGRDVATTGRLPADAVERAIAAIGRFRLLCETARVASVRVLATAAARVAENGPAFLARAEKACGFPVELLTGEREAELSAEGVISGIHRPDGVVGDLGGGSLELIEVGAAGIGAGVSLPLGGLVLKDRSGDNLKAARRIVRDELADAAPLRRLEGRTFYAVGGTWRALARIQMVETRHPMHVMHGYRLAIPRGGFAAALEGAGPGGAKPAEVVSEARRPLLAYGALLLDEIVRAGRPVAIVVSALGVREGLLFDGLPDGERDVDPLVAACSELNVLRSRDPRHGNELLGWTDVVFGALESAESPDERRLRHAACLLSDIGWRAHPDYRGAQSVATISHASLLGIDHPGRAYLALAVHFRHEGMSMDGADAALLALAGPRLTERARLLAATLRVAYPITVGMSGLLPRVPLRVSGGRIALRLPAALAPLANERLAGRLRALGRLLGREAAIEKGV